MDLTTIPALLTSIKTATEIAKLIKESNLSLENAETKFKLADLISTLADAKMQIADIQQSIIEKNDEIRSLKEQLSIKQKLKWKRPFYWINEGKGKEGPFCQLCYDQNHKLIRLQDYGDDSWGCKACKNTFYTSNTSNSNGKIESDDDQFNGF
jgi:hypothetical protein